MYSGIDHNITRVKRNSHEYHRVETKLLDTVIVGVVNPFTVCCTHIFVWVSVANFIINLNFCHNDTPSSFVAMYR